MFKSQAEVIILHIMRRHFRCDDKEAVRESSLQREGKILLVLEAESIMAPLHGVGFSKN